MRDSDRTPGEENVILHQETETLTDLLASPFPEEAVKFKPAVVSGNRDAWIRALGPDGSSDGLSFSGNRGLADTVLSGFTAAAAARRAA